MEIVADQSADSSAEARRKHRRSKLTNGSTLLPTTDGRSVWGRIKRDTYAALIVHCGGDDLISEPQRLIARRISTLEAELVFLEDSFAAARRAGSEPDIWRVDLYGRLADHQRRLSDPLGWQRTPRPVPTLTEYLASLPRDDEAGAVSVRDELLSGDQA